MVLRLCLISTLATLAFAGPYGAVTRGKGYMYWRLGNPNDVETKTHFGILFEGGGIDVDAAYQWMCTLSFSRAARRESKTKANGGDFLVIRSSGNGDYNPYIYGLCPSMNSVSTLLVSSKTGAQQPFVFSGTAAQPAAFVTRAVR
jgi:cyanophycinase